MAGHDDDNDGIQGWDAGASRASPIAGLSWQDFRNFVGRALNGDETVPASVRTRVNAALHAGEADLDRKDQHWWQAFLLRQAIDEQLRKIDKLIDQYRDMAAWHRAQAELARTHMMEAAGKLEEVDEFLKEADDVLGTASKRGKLDREKAIKLLKARGINVERDEADDKVAAKLNAERFKARNERTEWSDKHDRAKEDADYHDTQEAEDLRKAEELVQKRDVIRKGDYSADEQERLLRQTAEEYEADVRRKAADIEKGRDIQQSTSMLNGVQGQIDRAQVAQVSTEASDFEALAGTLTGEFQTAASNVKPEPDFQPPVPTGPPRSGPATSV